MSSEFPTKFLPGELGPLSEKPTVPDYIGIEEHKGFLICLWKLPNGNHRSGSIDPKGYWRLSQ